MIEVLLTGLRQVHALGQELPQQAIGILVAAALPRRMRVGKPDVDVQPTRQLPMAGQLGATVVGQALAQECGQLLHLPREAFQRRFGRAAIHLAQHDEPGLALDQRAHAGAIEGALDQIALPMFGNQALLHVLWAMHDALLLRHPRAFAAVVRRNPRVGLPWRSACTSACFSPPRG